MRCMPQQKNECGACPNKKTNAVRAPTRKRMRCVPQQENECGACPNKKTHAVRAPTRKRMRCNDAIKADGPCKHLIKALQGPLRSRSSQNPPPHPRASLHLRSASGGSPPDDAPTASLPAPPSSSSDTRMLESPLGWVISSPSLQSDEMSRPAPAAAAPDTPPSEPSTEIEKPLSAPPAPKSSGGIRGDWQGVHDTRGELIAAAMGAGIRL
eukprot:scaffold2073_cov101-Isochrysis_galbana.AAC.1